MMRITRLRANRNAAIATQSDGIDKKVTDRYHAELSSPACSNAISSFNPPLLAVTPSPASSDTEDIDQPPFRQRHQVDDTGIHHNNFQPSIVSEAQLFAASSVMALRQIPPTEIYEALKFDWTSTSLLSHEYPYYLDYLPNTSSSTSIAEEATKQGEVERAVPECPSRLERPEDVDELNRLSQFVRSDLVEVFAIPSVDAHSSEEGSDHSSSEEESDQSSPKNRRSWGAALYPGRIGLRCVHCARGKRSDVSKSVFFPNTIQDIYKGVREFQRVHFMNCSSVPTSVKKHYKQLKVADNTRGSVRYWASTAAKMGLVNSRDRDGRKGIVFVPRSS